MRYKYFKREGGSERRLMVARWLDGVATPSLPDAELAVVAVCFSMLAINFCMLMLWRVMRVVGKIIEVQRALHDQRKKSSD